MRLDDVKKTVRTRADGERYLHPKLLEGPAIGAQITLALTYFQGRLGQARRSVESETLIRFFGDPKVARGLVACLGETYRWRTQEFADLLDPPTLARLTARGLATPSALRLFLYDTLNQEGDGFLPAAREESLRCLATRLGLTPARLESLAALDAEENALLMRIGAVPQPEEIVGLYNFAVIDTLLRNSIWIELSTSDRAARSGLERAAAAYGLSLSCEDDAIRLHNRADLFGRYARAGAQLTRVLYTVAATCPTLLTAGRARLHLPGRGAIYLLERATRRALTAGRGAIHCAPLWPDLRPSWERQRAVAGTDRWQLHALPAPLLTAAGLALAPFVCRRDDVRVLVWPVRERQDWAAVAALRAVGVDLLPVLADDFAATAPGDQPWIAESAGATGVLAALGTYWSDSQESGAAQGLERLLIEVVARGFVPEAEAVTALNALDADDLAARLQLLDPTEVRYVPGWGVCSAAFALEMRKGLRTRRRRRAA